MQGSFNGFKGDPGEVPALARDGLDASVLKSLLQDDEGFAREVQVVAVFYAECLKNTAAIFHEDVLEHLVTDERSGLRPVRLSLKRG